MHTVSSLPQYVNISVTALRITNPIEFFNDNTKSEENSMNDKADLHFHIKS